MLLVFYSVSHANGANCTAKRKGKLLPLSYSSLEEWREEETLSGTSLLFHTWIKCYVLPRTNSTNKEFLLLCSSKSGEDSFRRELIITWKGKSWLIHIILVIHHQIIMSKSSFSFNTWPRHLWWLLMRPMELLILREMCPWSICRRSTGHGRSARPLLTQNFSLSVVYDRTSNTADNSGICKWSCLSKYGGRDRADYWKARN